MSLVAYDPCTMNIVQAWTIIIVHACTTITVHACTMVIVHACTMVIIHACTMIIAGACTMVIVHISGPTSIMFDKIKCSARGLGAKSLGLGIRNHPNGLTRKNL